MQDKLRAINAAARSIAALFNHQSIDAHQIAI
jgi:hypothetical protein